jgi:hypothetical protein
MLRQGIFLNEMKGFDELRRILFANVTGWAVGNDLPGLSDHRGFVQHARLALPSAVSSTLD